MIHGDSTHSAYRAWRFVKYFVYSHIAVWRHASRKRHTSCNQCKKSIGTLSRDRHTNNSSSVMRHHHDRVTITQPFVRLDRPEIVQGFKRCSTPANKTIWNLFNGRDLDTWLRGLGCGLAPIRRIGLVTIESDALQASSGCIYTNLPNRPLQSTTDSVSRARCSFVVCFCTQVCKG